MRRDTDVVEPTGWSELPTDEHPSHPQPRTSPQERVRPKGLRPHRKYYSPEEMWAWHWCKMRIALMWTLIAVICVILITAGIVIFSELT